MTLSPGDRLGPYEIVARLGAGGMGEVYRALDTRLERPVAVKVLSAALAADAAGRQRFEREARAISKLSHPHICIVHDVGRERLRPARGAGGKRGAAAPPSASERASTGSARPELVEGRGWGPASTEEARDFLVMELLEGETLQARLGRGAFPLDDAVGCAIEIADALAAAHAHGILHRDLKPANIMLTPSGAKLLDFGLAKMTALAAGDATAPPTGTVAGAVIGTVGYMSPEQARGETVAGQPPM